MESRIQQTLSGPPGQQFILSITDTEATSLLAKELAKYDESPVRNLLVWFTKGRIYAVGRLANVVPIETDVSIVATSRVQGGKIAIKIEQLSAADMTLPSSVVDLISQSINETVTDLQLNLEITDLEILEGEAIVKGVRQ